MKKSLLLLCVLVSNVCVFGQTNTFPSDGNVGVGTTSPTEKLDVNGKTVSNSLKIDGYNAITSVNGFTNKIELTGAGNAALVYKPGDVKELMFGFHDNGNFYWGTGRSATKPNFYSMILNGNTGDLTVYNWIRPKGNAGIFFQDHGGGFHMTDNSWIRTYGNKNFYHNTGVMRTDGNLQVGPNGNRFIVNTAGNVGIGTTTPAQKLDVNGAVQSESIILVDPNLGSNSDFTALYREDAGNDNAVVKLRIGDDQLGSFNIGYKYWSTGEWVSTFFVNNYGKVGIGTTTPDAKLTVKGNIHAEEVKIDLSVPAPDYVFTKDYDLLTIEEVQKHIAEQGHLPNIPSATEMETNGVELGLMNMKLLEKIEELTLYTIAQEKQLKKQETINRELQTQNNNLDKELESQKSKFYQLEKKLNQLLKNK